MAVPVALVVFMLDDSSSMRDSHYVGPTIKAFNAYVDTLKKTKGAEIKFSLCKFGDDLGPTLQWAAPVQDAIELSRANYSPTRGTAIYASLIELFRMIESELKTGGARKVVVCIQTDGETGDSYEVREKIPKIMREKMAKGWEFIFMAATDGPGGFDYMQIAHETLGIPKANIIPYSGSESGTMAAFSAAAWNVGSYTSGRTANAGFSELQRQKAKG